MAVATHSERSPDSEFVALRDIDEERRDRDQNRCARPQQREAHRVDTGCPRTFEQKTVSNPSTRCISRRSPRVTGKARTLDHPLHLALAGLHDALDPLVLPGEELDELDRADELVQHAHTLVSSGRDALLDAHGAASHEVVERPSEEQDEESRER